MIHTFGTVSSQLFLGVLSQALATFFLSHLLLAIIIEFSDGDVEDENQSVAKAK